MFLSDLHTHTWLSVDGSESVDALCEAALRQGLGAIAITDHWDGFLPGLRDKGYAPHFMDSRDFWKLHGAKLFPEISAARDKYAGRLRIRSFTPRKRRNSSPHMILTLYWRPSI